MIMTIKRAAALALPITIAALTGCSSTPSAPPRAAPPTVRSIAVSPADYMARAASASLFIIKASDRISGSAGETALGQFARNTRAEQQAIGSQLNFAGRRLNLLPSAVLLPSDQAMLDALVSSSEPSASYVRQMKRVLAEALSLHRGYERYGTSPTLRPVAAMAAPLFAAELEALDHF